MNRASTVFLKVMLLLLAAGALATLVRFPQTEGRAAHLDTIGVYTDPAILYLYLASIPFFVAVWHAFALLGLIEKQRAFSHPAVDRVRTIKYCAIATLGLLVVGLVWVKVASGGDDPAGAIMVGLCLTVGSLVVATATTVVQDLLQRAVDLQAGQDRPMFGTHP